MIPRFLFVLTLGALGMFLPGNALARSFKDKTGRVIEAEMVARQGDQIRIKRVDGREFNLAVSLLSDEDQKFVQEWQAPAAGSSATPAAPVGPVTPATDPRLKPGATVELTFPSLPKDHNGDPAACNVRIPETFDPTKPVPLLVWITGGKGSNKPDGGFSLVDKTKYVIAGLPYPDTAPSPNKAMGEGKIDVILDYQQIMLAELVKLLPNLDPQVRIVAGFSNGAHTIGSGISEGRKEFIELFNAFVVIEGGAQTNSSKRKLRDKYGYFAWGNTGNGSKTYMKLMMAAAKDARLEVTEHEMDGVAHEFPATEKELVKNWIEKTVIPGLRSAKGRS
ncbi:MAG TPA: SHD1 domain-containing protein [Verrucomicrobium sp.]|nr:SHD1 domain-containing protein [Verrucomicrobium sp.]